MSIWDDTEHPDTAKVRRLEVEIERLRAREAELMEAGKVALHEMVNTVAPRSSFTDAVDQLDAALAKVEGKT